MILADPAGNIYYPEEAINTIINWDNQSGYLIKTNNGFEITFYGNLYPEKSLSLTEGWNLIPVLSDCDVEAESLFAGTALTIAKEVAGNLVYWPGHGIHTLTYLKTGRAYYVMMDDASEITFPECEGKTKD